jgi:hypothetical protein
MKQKIKDLFDPYNPTIFVVLGVLFFGWLFIKHYVL